MPDAAAKIRLKAMTAWDQEPLLSEDEIDNLLTMFSVTDASGVVPSGDDWVPTYNLRGAAREGWTWKMGRAAALVSTDLDGDRESANQVFDQCERMVKRYSNTASVSSTAADLTDL